VFYYLLAGAVVIFIVIYIVVVPIYLILKFASFYYPTSFVFGTLLFYETAGTSFGFILFHLVNDSVFVIGFAVPFTAAA